MEMFHYRTITLNKNKPKESIEKLSNALEDALGE